MKTIIILLIGVLVSACSSIPSLGPGSLTKVWHVHPDDMERFRADSALCEQLVRGSGDRSRLFDGCLQKAGYRLEVVAGD